MFKIKGLFFLLTIVGGGILSSLPLIGTCQQLLRPTIGSSGGGGFGPNNLYVNQSIGQPYGTLSYYGSKTSIHPGFEQPFNAQSFVGSSTLVSLTLFPNPTTDFVILSASAELNNALLEVFDFGGRKIFEKKIETLTNYKLECANWSSGFYLIRLTDSLQNVYSSKIVVTK